jgi:hypothetical protein
VVSVEGRIYAGAVVKFPSRVRPALLLTLALVGCTRAEPKPQPLGLGPLAVAEHAELAALDGGTPVRSNPPGKGTSPSDAGVVRSPAPQPSNLPERTLDASLPIDGGLTTDGAAPSLEGWVGLYRGSDTTKSWFPPVPPREVTDPNAQTRVETENATTLRLVLVDSSTGNDICSLKATVATSEATVQEGQTCFGSEDSGQSARIRSGKARRVDRELTLDLLLYAEVDDEDPPVHGTLEYHFVGKR